VVVVDTVRLFVEPVAVFSALAGVMPDIVLDIGMVVTKSVV
jgi:hypothetical protein